jgi:glutamine amidotransferase
MCRIFGCVAADSVSVRRELVEVENPLIRQSEEHDSGWGMAVYPHGAGEEPRCMRFQDAAYEDGFEAALDARGRIFNVHLRRATMGGLSPENTHPFCLGSYSFSHNGTIIGYPKLLEDGVATPAGDTDSEAFFNFLIHDFDDGQVRNSLRRTVRRVIERSPFSGLNFLFSDGYRLYAYRLGIFELHWLARPGQLIVASERMTADERWHEVRQDVLLTLDPSDLVEPHAERLVGDEWVARAEIKPFEEGKELRGAERGDFAAQRAARLAAE